MISEVKIWIMKEWKKYIPVIGFFMFIIFKTNRMFIGTGDSVSFVEYLYVMLEGSKPPNISNIKMAIVEIPYLYMILNLYITYIIAYYPFKNKQSIDMQFVLKYQKKCRWWIRKCIWNIFVVLSVYFIGFLMFLMTDIITGSISNDKIINSGYECYNALSPDKILMTGVVSVIISAGIHMFQMMLSMVVDKAVSLIITISIYIISIYKCGSLFLGNYMMMHRYISWNGTAAINLHIGFIMGLILLAVGIVAGGIFIKKVEFL